MTMDEKDPASGTAGDKAAGDLARLLHGGRPSDIHRRLSEALSDPLFEPREGLTSVEQCELSYARLRVLGRHLPSAVSVTLDPRSLFALLDATAAVDTTLAALAAIHYNLCLGTLLDHVAGQPGLQSYVDELDTLGSVGVFMATELGYGNNVKALETRAVFDPGTGTFTLRTPTPRAQKYMPNTAVAVPKIAVVLARLVVGRRDHGVFPFVVRIRDSAGPCPGVRIVPLPEKPGLALDNAVTVFDDVRLPRDAVMLGGHSHLAADGTFRSSMGQHQRFLNAMQRVVPGKLGLTGAHLACARAAVAITSRYSTQRLTFAPGKSSVPVIEHQAHRRALVGALAGIYAMSLLVNRARRELDACSGKATAAVERLVAVTKVNASRAAEQAVLVCRERCGAQGMFSRNRIADYVAFGHLVVTSEGDNDVIALKAAQQMVMESGYRQPAGKPTISGDLRDIGFLTRCLRERERRLHEGLVRRVTAGFEKGTGSFALWNALATDLLALTRAHGLRLAAEELESALADAAGTSGSALLPVATVFALREIAADAHWYLMKQILSAEQVRQMPALLDSLCGEAASFLDVLVDGFDVPLHRLRAPIAGDYLHAYDCLSAPSPGTPPPAPDGTAQTGVERAGFYVDAAAPRNRWGRELDARRDANLLDHQVKGRPTLPGSHMLEIAAEAAAGVAPGLAVIRFSDVRFHSFLRMDPHRPSRFRAEAGDVREDAGGRRVTVRVLSDVVHSSGRVLRQGRPHAEATVHLAAEADRPAPPPCPLDTAALGTRVVDPYFLPAVPMRLLGVYDNTRECWFGPMGSATALDLGHTAGDSAFTRFVIPCLAVDALTRVPCPDPDGASRVGVAVPLGYEGLDLYTGLNDIGLFAAHGTALTLLREPMTIPNPAFYLVSVTGQVLIRMTRPHLRVVAWIPDTALRGEPVTPDAVVTAL